MKRVYRARDVTDAQLIRDMLADAGLRATVLGESLASGSFELPAAGITPEVWVEDADGPAATERVHRMFQPIDPPTCRGCGYDLRGLSEARCPECGLPFRRHGEPWTCPTCGEVLEAQFTECWRCAGRTSPHGVE